MYKGKEKNGFNSSDASEEYMHKGREKDGYNCSDASEGYMHKCGEEDGYNCSDASEGYTYTSIGRETGESKSSDVHEEYVLKGEGRERGCGYCVNKNFDITIFKVAVIFHTELHVK
jgi:hypothetical protein